MGMTLILCKKRRKEKKMEQREKKARALTSDISKMVA